MLTSPQLLHELEVKYEQLKEENFQLQEACRSVHKQHFNLLEEAEALYQILEQNGIEVTIEEHNDE